MPRGLILGLWESIFGFGPLGFDFGHLGIILDLWEYLGIEFNPDFRPPKVVAGPFGFDLYHYKSILGPWESI